jgi:ActR/RegA family two-component response regulator
MALHPGNRPRQRVLVVDDDRLIQRAARSSLERAGFDVVTADSIAGALAVAGRFDVALVDYFLAAGECGCDLIGPLRAAHPSIRIVIVSGLAALADLVRHALSAGADLVASKTQPDWPALARAPVSAPAPVPPGVNLAALKRELTHGAYLVHNRNVTVAARALGIKRSSLQRRLRRAPLPRLDVEEE